MVNKLFFTLTILAYSVQSWSWSHHNRLTQIATQNLNLQKQFVTVTDFSVINQNLAYLLQDLKTLKIQDLTAFDPKLNFNENIKINKSYVFTTSNVGSKVTVADVLNFYSDEPDQGMDQLLFNQDQYPEIWKSEYVYMGGSDPSEALPTQAFRHFYWEAWSPVHLAITFKLPTAAAMGQAPDRAALFLALSKRAKELKLDYWSVRFMANALHYLEDVSQPYHSVQTPTKIFWSLPFTDPRGDGFHQGLSGFTTQITNIITYYHFSFEDYVANLMEKYFNDPASAPEAVQFITALSAKPGESLTSMNMATRVKALSSQAVNEATIAGKSSINFFPNLPTTAKFATFGTADIENYMNADFWTTVFKNGEANSPQKQAYFGVVCKMFQLLGPQLRAVASALSN